MDQRKIQLIVRLVDQYIQSAQPVGSVFLVKKYNLDFSSATIRNEMALLEELGYLAQPHSSAGRIPTERGYDLYLQHIRPGRIAVRNAERIEACFQHHGPKRIAALVAVLSETTNELAFWTDGTLVHRSGFRYLAQKPECIDPVFLETFGEILDQLHMTRASMQKRDGPQILLGAHGNLSPSCSAIALDTPDGIFGILGPMRMDYPKNLGLIDYLWRTYAPRET